VTLQPPGLVPGARWVAMLKPSPAFSRPSHPVSPVLCPQPLRELDAPRRSCSLLSRLGVWVSATSLGGDSQARALSPRLGGCSGPRGGDTRLVGGSAGVPPRPGCKWHWRALKIVFSGHPKCLGKGGCHEEIPWDPAPTKPRGACVHPSGRLAPVPAHGSL